MTTVFSTFPEEGTPQFAEMARRQNVVLGVSALPTRERERLFRDERLGVTWLPDRKPKVSRPRTAAMLANPIAYEPSILVKPVATPPTPRPRHTPSPARKRWWQFWK